MSEEELEMLENDIMNIIDRKLKLLKNEAKKDLLDMLIDSMMNTREEL